MMEDDDEDGIWNYKSPSTNRRKRRSTDNQPKKTVTLSTGPCARSEEKKSYRKAVKKTHKVKTPSKTKTRHSTGNIVSSTPNVGKPDRSDHVGVCPSCQMPFSLLISGSPQTHVTQCMETDCQAQDECPSGIDCSSTTKLHYQLFNHRLLAEYRDRCTRGDNPHNHTAEIEKKASIPAIVIIGDSPQKTLPSEQPVSTSLKSSQVLSSKKNRRQNSSQSKSARKDGKSNSASKPITSFFCSQTASKSPNISRRRLKYSTQNTDSIPVKDYGKKPRVNVSQSHEELRILDCLKVDDDVADRDISDMLADALCSNSESESETNFRSKVGQSDGSNEVIDLVCDNLEEPTSESADFCNGLKDVDADKKHFSARNDMKNDDENCYAKKNISDYEEKCGKTNIIDILNCEEQVIGITNSDKNNCANCLINDDVRNPDLCCERDETSVKVLNCESDPEDSIFNIAPVAAVGMNNAAGSEEDIFYDKREVTVSKKSHHQREITCEPNHKIRGKMNNASAERKVTPRKSTRMKKQNSLSKQKKSAECDPKQPSLLSFFQLKSGTKRVNVTENKLGTSRNKTIAGNIKNCPNDGLNTKNKMEVRHDVKLEPSTNECLKNEGNINKLSHKSTMKVEDVKPNDTLGMSSAHNNHSNLKPENKQLENGTKTNSIFDTSKKTDYHLCVPSCTLTNKSKPSDRQSTGSITPVKTESESERSYSSSGYGNRKPNRPCPFYKKMPGTSFTVDAFCYGTVPGCSAYFLTHFHYDHYRGLNKHFQHTIYCSQITANLVKMKLYVRPEFIKTIPLDTPTIVDGVEVTFMEANHCPGSVLILFKLKDGNNLLHTGDFRADPSMEEYPPLIENKIHTLYLDTTYCDPSYAFPEQSEVIKIAVTLVNEVLHKNPKTLIVCGSYTIGKERVFTAIAQSLGCKIGVTREKKKILDCLEDGYLQGSLTLNLSEAQLHILPMGHLNLKNWKEMNYKCDIRAMRNLSQNGNWLRVLLSAPIRLFVILSFVCVDIGTAIFERYIQKSHSTGLSAHIGGLLAGLLVGVPFLRNVRRNPCETRAGWVTLIVYLLFVVGIVFFNIFYKGYPPTDWN